jgi:hypothetical protein
MWRGRKTAAVFPPHSFSFSSKSGKIFYKKGFFLPINAVIFLFLNTIYADRLWGYLPIASIRRETVNEKMDCITGSRHGAVRL